MSFSCRTLLVLGVIDAAAKVNDGDTLTDEDALTLAYGPMLVLGVLDAAAEVDDGDTFTDEVAPTLTDGEAPTLADGTLLVLGVLDAKAKLVDGDTLTDEDALTLVDGALLVLGVLDAAAELIDGDTFTDEDALTLDAIDSFGASEGFGDELSEGAMLMPCFTFDVCGVAAERSGNGELLTLADGTMLVLGVLDAVAEVNDGDTLTDGDALTLVDGALLVLGVLDAETELDDIGTLTDEDALKLDAVDSFGLSEGAMLMPCFLGIIGRLAVADGN